MDQFTTSPRMASVYGKDKIGEWMDWDRVRPWEERGTCVFCEGVVHRSKGSKTWWTLGTCVSACPVAYAEDWCDDEGFPTHWPREFSTVTP